MPRSNSRMFSLYVKTEGRFERLSSSAYDKAKATKMFEPAVTAGTVAGLNVQIRPVHETAKTGDPTRAYQRFKSYVLPVVEGKVWFVPAGSPEWAVTLPQQAKVDFQARQAAKEAALSEV